MESDKKDSDYSWHPFTPGMRDKSTPIITRAEGQYLYDDSGNRFFDAISSWWTCTHGHRNPKIVSAIKEQLDQLDHVLFAGYTHASAKSAADNLIALLPKDQQKVFFSDNGSTAVEVALKMALQYWLNNGKKRTKIMALKGGYHGDTFGAMSAGVSSGFFSPFKELLFNVQLIDRPTHGSVSPETLKIFVEQSDEIAAFIYEPLVQGSAGMKFVHKSGLDQILELCKEKGILCIADEVMTGFGRTGTSFASEQLTHKPDIFCFSKGLTGGFMALGATTANTKVTAAFESSDPGKMLLHGHSYTANPIACSAATASLKLHREGVSEIGIERIIQSHRKQARRFKENNFRTIGTILAIELNVSGDYFKGGLAGAIPFFRERGVIIRPLGNVLYLIPPYCSTEKDLELCYSSLEEYVSSQA